MRWRFAAASVRGTSHEKAGTRLQDAKRCLEIAGDGAASSLALIVSDGAGSAAFGGEGASLVCRTLAAAVRANIRQQGELPDEETIHSWIDEVRDRIQVCAEKRSLTQRDFAATLVLVIATPKGILTAHIGDGAAVGRSRSLREWQVLSPPARGEYAATTFFVTDDPEPQLRITCHDADYDAIAVFTDGIEDLVIDRVSGKASPGFFEPMTRPVAASPSPGRNRELSDKLAAYLSSDRLNERTDDDKTLIIAVQNE
jgi:serine/threonine protein phosphatase PrpC